MKKVMTVLGPVLVSELGVTSMHEHILLDTRCWFKEPSEPTRKMIAHQKLSLNNLGYVWRNPFSIRDNMILDDVDSAINELMEFKRAGGNTIVDVTNVGLGRDPLMEREISIRTKVNVIAACGFYIEKSLPSSILEKSIEKITDQLVREIKEGIGSTGVYPGIIGEIGTSEPITKNEEKVLRAAAGAHLVTGLPILVHLTPRGRDKTGLNVLDILEEEGVPLKAVILSHLDTVIDLNYHKAVADRGAYICYDNFGKEFYVDEEPDFQVNPRDTERINALVKLKEEGYLSQIVLGCDICLKQDLHAYGGWGYDHILTNILPRLEKAGFSKEEIQTMLISNPAEALSSSLK